mgnify:CR=1 FL=1
MSNKVKVNFVYYDLDEELATESVWAEKENNYYRIKNIPFFAPNISYDDLISVEEDEEELFFDDIIETSGNSTLQIIIYNKNDIADITKMIEHFGCGWEGSHLEGYISVNVPKKVNYIKVKEFLDIMFDSKKLDYKEACLAHSY